MKILYTASVLSHICQFHFPVMELLQQQGYIVHVAARDNLVEKNGLRLNFTDQYFNINFQRSPKSKANIGAYKHLKKIIDEQSYDVILCNTPVVGVLTRLAARSARRKGTRVIYMVHGFHFFKGAPLLNWLVYYPVEKIMSLFADTIITINREDYNFACKNMFCKDIRYVPGVGFNYSKFVECHVDKTHKREEIGVPEGYKWVLSVGELLPDKNHASAIRAIANIPDVYYTIAGNGALDKYLQNLAQSLGMADRFKLLGYRRDIPELCNSADLFVFPSKFEGLPLALMEAMASGLPVACSRVRGCADLVDEKGGLLFQPYNISEIAECINTLLHFDNESMKTYNREKSRQFSVESVKMQIAKILMGEKGQ